MMRSLLASCSAILLLGVPLLAQRPEARRHLTEGIGLFHEHDDTGDALVGAQAEFAAALRLEPRYCAARAYQGLVDLEMNHESEAEAAFREALSWDPKCAEALVGQARLKIRHAPIREALPLLRQAVAVAPRNKLPRWDLAYALSAEASNPTPEMWKEAMECWRVLIAMDRNDRDAHYDLARALRRFARWKEAEPHFREVLRIGQTKEDSDVWVYAVHAELGETLAKLGKNAQAIREYQALIASEGAGDEEIRHARQAIEALQKRR
jgi:tetratricopeptide (TPR) repeat protein